VEQEKMSVAGQKLGKHDLTAINTQATIEELLDTVFSVQSVLYRILKM
jgi:hypothetical protein